MICPNCKSNIPDDSRFCPDCGKPVQAAPASKQPVSNNEAKDRKTEKVNADALREETKKLTQNFPRGYKFFVKKQILPQFVYNLRPENCKKILNMKQEIIARDKEILAKEKEERRQKKEQQQKATLKEARNIINNYRKGYDYCVQWGHCNALNSNSPIADAERIVQNKNYIIQKDKELRPPKPTKTTSSTSTKSSTSSSSGSSFFDWGAAWALGIIFLIIGFVAAFFVDGIQFEYVPIVGAVGFVIGGFVD